MDNSILETLDRTRELQATDPGDKVHALLGISVGWSPNSGNFAIEYRRPYKEVYVDLARSLVDTGSCDVFGYIRGRPTFRSKWMTQDLTNKLWLYGLDDDTVNGHGTPPSRTIQLLPRVQHFAKNFPATASETSFPQETRKAEDRYPET